MSTMAKKMAKGVGEGDEAAGDGLNDWKQSLASFKVLFSHEESTECRVQGKDQQKVKSTIGTIENTE